MYTMCPPGYIYTIMYTMCPPGYYHNGFMATPELGAQDVRLHIVGLHCGVTRVLKLQAVSEGKCQ